MTSPHLARAAKHLKALTERQRKIADELHAILTAPTAEPPSTNDHSTPEGH